MLISIWTCIISFGLLVYILRNDGLSFGLPIAYLAALLLIHLPGAFAHYLGGTALLDTDYAEIGIRFTAIGVVCFVIGVWVTRLFGSQLVEYGAANRSYWPLFCLIAGWVFTYGLSSLGRIPTLGAAIEKGGAIWMLGVMIGLRDSVSSQDVKRSTMWLGALAVYPTLMLLLGGFLSYGSTAVIIVISTLAISTRDPRRVVVGIIVASLIGLNIFLNSFGHRDAIRTAVWGGAPMDERIDVSMNMFREFEMFDPTNEVQLLSLDQRLNQNYFAGLAATRIDDGQVNYLYGRSVWDGLVSLIPRFFWPEKPVFGGSPKIVSEMTGLVLNENTSFGVGNVMEFQINFGIPGLVAGFLILGLILGFLDRKAAQADCDGDLSRLFRYFLPAVALIQPNGSLVELVSGSAAALAAAYVWKWVWEKFFLSKSVENANAANIVIGAT